MTDPPRLRDLEARLERATGADRELDARIWCWIAGFEFVSVAAAVIKIKISGNDATADLTMTTRYTESIDAADALRKRVLPEGIRRSAALANSAVANVWSTMKARCAYSKAPTEPLAILLATIRALIAREEGR